MAWCRPRGAHRSPNWISLNHPLPYFNQSPSTDFRLGNFPTFLSVTQTIPMSLKRRDFIRLSAGKASFGAALLYGLPVGLNDPDAGVMNGPDAGVMNDPDAAVMSHPGINILTGLKPMTGDVVPITVEERQARIQKARRLMAENKIEALILDSGTSMVYFTFMSWGQSERTMVAIIPAKGEEKYVCPAFA